jgi:hypothetical protein
MTASGQPGPRWHALSVAAALAASETDRSGLSDREAASRLQRYGPNRLSPPRPVSALTILRDQLTGVVVLLLFAAAVISLLLGDRLKPPRLPRSAINTLIGSSRNGAPDGDGSPARFDAPRATVVREASCASSTRRRRRATSST